MSQCGYLELRHPSRDTGPFPVQRPQNSRASCQVWVVFSLQREPWELPDDKAVTHPRARQSRRNCRDTQDLWSSLHPAESLQGLWGDLPRLAGRADEVEEKSCQGYGVFCLQSRERSGIT